MSRAKENKKGVDGNEYQPDFRRSDAEITDAEFIGSSKTQIGVHHEGAEDGEDKEEEVFKVVWQDEGISDEDRTEKNII